MSDVELTQVREAHKFDEAALAEYITIEDQPARQVKGIRPGQPVPCVP